MSEGSSDSFTSVMSLSMVSNSLLTSSGRVTFFAALASFHPPHCTTWRWFRGIRPLSPLSHSAPFLRGRVSVPADFFFSVSAFVINLFVWFYMADVLKRLLGGFVPTAKLPYFI
jgi:hypothetical protein